MSGQDSSRERLRGRLLGLGFDEVRFASAGPVPAAGLANWLAAGHHASMDWMERNAARRLDPGVVLPGARSVVMLGVNYWDGGGNAGGRTPTWARYALYRDYHDTIGPALAAAARAVAEMTGAGEAGVRHYVDTGPVLERGWAARSGLGFRGKNAMLISRRHGNWLFLAAILTTADLGSDEPLAPGRDRGDPPAEPAGLLCGKCTRCMDACPTRAFAAPGVVDARLCISYLTIEHKGAIPRPLRPAIGVRVFGCDACLEVCPWNRFARAARRTLLEARPGIAALGWEELLGLTEERFREVFRGTAVRRLKLAGLLRNACVAAGNTGDASLAAPLARLAGHELALVRIHAVWAVRRLGAGRLLAAARAVERDPDVLAEYEATP
jgi:epoxyqueuosine reductase